MPLRTPYTGEEPSVIKNLLMASAAVALATTAVMAADLPSRRAPPVYIPPAPPAFSWTGVDLGLTTSYSFSGSKNDTITPLNGVGGQPNIVNLSKSGLDTVGGGVGYNYQFTPGSGIVVGGFVDVNYLNLRKYVPTIAVGGLGGDVQERVGYLGTVNGHLGYAFDHFMVYGAGGFAFAGLHTSANLYTFGNPFPYTASNNGTATGYNYGGGIEYAIPNDSFLNYLSVEKLVGKFMGGNQIGFLNFLNTSTSTLRVEFIHYDLGSRTVIATGGDAVGGAYVNRFRTQGNVIKFGLGYHFGTTSAPIPVVARY